MCILSAYSLQKRAHSCVSPLSAGEHVRLRTRSRLPSVSPDLIADSAVPALSSHQPHYPLSATLNAFTFTCPPIMPSPSFSADLETLQPDLCDPKPLPDRV